MYANNESRANCLLYECALKSIDVLEDSPPDALFNAIRTKFGLSEKELFTNYSLFKEAIYNLLGRNNSDIIIDMMRKEIIRMSHHSKNDPVIKEILNIFK